MRRCKPIPSIPALTLYVIVPLLLSPILLAQQVCYWPDGTEATSHVPCNSSASNTPNDASSCCHDLAVSYCQENNLCTWNGAMYRGACTDKTWRSPNCPQQCTGAQRDTFMNIYPCSSAGVWECERAGQCTTNFTLPPFGILLRDSQLPGNPKEGIGLADPHPSTDTVSAATVTARKAIGTADIAAPPTPSSSPTITITKSKTSIALAVGLGVGIPLGLLLITCMLLLWHQQKRLKETVFFSPSSSSSSASASREKVAGDYYNNDNKKEKKKERRRFPIRIHHHHPHSAAAQELHEQRAVPELRDQHVKSVHELGVERAV